MTVKTGAVVLAAGQSRRMGRPKMTLPWKDTTVIGQVVQVLLTAGLEELVVVTGGHHQGVEDALSDMPVRTVYNPQFANGEMLTTLQVGLAALKPGLETSLVVLGDQPQVEAQLVQSLLAAQQEHPGRLVVPSYQKRRGHPWLLPRVFWAEVQALGPPETMRTFLNQKAASIHYLDLDTPSILGDLDTPEDYQLARSGDYE